MAQHIGARFDSYERFTQISRRGGRAFRQRLWLVWRAGALQIVTTANAGTPLVRGDTPLLALDLWEHAYYQNRRGAYVNTFLEDLVSWEDANRALASLTAASDLRAAPRRLAVELPLPRHGP